MPEEKKTVLPLIQTRMKEESYARNSFFVTCPVKTDHKDLLDPVFWRNLGQQFHQFDKVTAVTEDGQWYAEYVVVGCDRLWAKLALVKFIDLSGEAKNTPLREDENYEVLWKGPVNKFTVIRKQDSASLKDGFNTQLEGWQWLDGHLKSLAA